MKRYARDKRVERKFFVLLLVLAVVVVAGYSLGRYFEVRERKPETRGEYNANEQSETIVYDSKTYQRRKNQTSILLMGIDQDADQASTARMGGGQADFLELIVIDDDAQTVLRLPIDRDTMTQISVLGVLGNLSGVRTAQISLSHGFGDGKEQSCELTVQAVSNLLQGLEPDFYIAMNLDGIDVLNDLSGGVTVTLEDDFSEFDAEMTKGTTLTLQGHQAEIYVRSRMSVGEGTNSARMSRQEAYLEQLMVQLDAKMRKNQNFTSELFDGLQDYLTTDISRGRLINLVWGARDYERKEAYSIAGEHKVGSDGFMQFYADEDAVAELVLEMCYEEVQ